MNSTSWILPVVFTVEVVALIGVAAVVALVLIAAARGIALAPLGAVQ